MIAVTVLLDVHALSMLAGVLEDEGVEGYPGAERALDEATWLDVLGGVRVRDRIVSSRLFTHIQVTVRTTGNCRERIEYSPTVNGSDPPSLIPHSNPFFAKVSSP